MHPISYATQSPSCSNVELFSLPRRNDVSDEIQADYPLPLVRLCTRERSILGSKREPSRLASLQLLVGPKRTILVIKMELGRKERWLAVELFLFFFLLGRRCHRGSTCWFTDSRTLVCKSKPGSRSSRLSTIVWMEDSLAQGHLVASTIAILF